MNEGGLRKANRHGLIDRLFFDDNTQEDERTQMLDMVRDIRTCLALILWVLILIFWRMS